MQPERLEKVKSLLALALSKPPPEREAFLASACTGDPTLRSEVDRYLGVGDRTDQFIYTADTVPDVKISLETPPPAVTVQVQADQRIGKQFGKYIIRSRLAEGGMGIVYLALDTQLGREVALKVLPEYFSMDRERLARFHREARATSLLNHPNIVTVFEIGQMEGCQYIVTEFVEGKTLRDLMRQGQIPFVEMLKIASQVAGALATAHRAGIIHRDIKPENVMVRPDGYVKVLDFGLAKLTDPTRTPALGNSDFGPGGVNQTAPGMIMGTVAYMSPEQAEGLETDARTDIWSLGVILYEMVARKVPFSGPSASHTIVAILERDPEELQNASPELKQLIATALQKDRALRFQKAEAISGAIDELKHRLGYISDQHVSGPPTTEKNISIPGGPAPTEGIISMPAPPMTEGIISMPAPPMTEASISISAPSTTEGSISMPDPAPTAGIISMPVPSTAEDIAISGPLPSSGSISMPAPAVVETEIAPAAALRRPSPYRKLLWLVPAAFVVLLAASIGIYAVVSWLLDPTRNGPVPPANRTVPTPESTDQIPVVQDTTPSPSPPVIYVDPTPEAQPSVRPVPVEKPDRQTVPERRPEPTPTPRRVEPSKTPVKKPKPTQDPNCVFTNSCK